jgi:hypothetical protein
VPVLVMSGEQDKLIPVEDARADCGGDTGCAGW